MRCEVSDESYSDPHDGTCMRRTCAASTTVARIVQRQKVALCVRTAAFQWGSLGRQSLRGR
jgi:hypothetical protein